MKKTIWILTLMTILALSIATAVECGSTPTEGCYFNGDTTITNDTYELADVYVNESGITITALDGTTFGNTIFNFESGVENVTLSNFTIYNTDDAVDYVLVGTGLHLDNMNLNMEMEFSNAVFGGDNAILENSKFGYCCDGALIFTGDDILIDNNFINSGSYTAMSEPSYPDFSGQVINNCINRPIAVDSYSGEINFTLNLFGGGDDGAGGCEEYGAWTSFSANEDATGDIYFYGNGFLHSNTGINDETDYPTYAVTWCIDNFGNVGYGEWVYDNGDPLEGTCCVEIWSEDEYLSCDDGQYFSTYTETNSCGTAYDLPATNGTYKSCDWVVGTHATGDVTNVVVDGVAEFGIQMIQFAGLIAMVGLGIYVLTII